MSRFIFCFVASLVTTVLSQVMPTNVVSLPWAIPAAYGRIVGTTGGYYYYPAGSSTPLFVPWGESVSTTAQVQVQAPDTTSGEDQQDLPWAIPAAYGRIVGTTGGYYYYPAGSSTSTFVPWTITSGSPGTISNVVMIPSLSSMIGSVGSASSLIAGGTISSVTVG